MPLMAVFALAFLQDWFTSDSTGILPVAFANDALSSFAGLLENVFCVEEHAAARFLPAIGGGFLLWEPSPCFVFC